MSKNAGYPIDAGTAGRATVRVTSPSMRDLKPGMRAGVRSQTHEKDNRMETTQ